MAQYSSFDDTPVQPRTPSLTLLTLGPVGAGKSALVNNFVGGPAAIESDPPTKVTENIGSYKLNKDHFDVTIFDTPGLLSPDTNDEDTLEEISRIDEVDVILFCFDMKSRIDSRVEQLMTKLTESFGKLIWQNVVVVLTFSNEVKLAQRGQTTGETSEEHFANKLQMTKDAFLRLLETKVEISPETANAILFVPAGYEDPRIFGCDDWLAEFWKKVQEKKATIRRPASLRIIHRPKPQPNNETYCIPRCCRDCFQRLRTYLGYN